MRSHWIRLGPKSNRTGVLMRRGTSGHRDTKTDRGEEHVTEAKTGVRRLQDKERQGLLSTTGARRGAWSRLSPGTSEGPWPADTLSSDF